MHAVHRLYQHRKNLSTVIYKSRGHKVIRCEQCRISVDHCICALTPMVTSNAAFLLLMYDTEVLKPSNTGKLIADIIPDTFAFLWSRTEVDPALLTLLNDDKWQPYVVFPEQYVEQPRVVIKGELNSSATKRPLFIMLDGSWREAKKMFRKSPYLNRFPVFAFDPEKINEQLETSRYQIRSAAIDNQFATAEVAARILAFSGETVNANVLDLWFDVFNYQYQKSVCQTTTANTHALDNFNQYLAQQGIVLKK